MPKKNPGAGVIKPKAGTRAIQIVRSSPGYIEFELDLIGAIVTQLPPCISSMTAAPLTLANARALPNAQGVYQLIHDGIVKYVGKTDADAGLRARLSGHVQKFMHRDNIAPASVFFKAIHILVLTAMDIETELIREYRNPEWNGSGFGSNDPGRNREETDKPVYGFDSQFPINIDLPLDFVSAGTGSVHALLILLKENLPYVLRYQTTTTTRTGFGYKTHPHSDYVATLVTVPDPPITARQLLRLIVAALPHGWQATVFPSHVILYRETMSYAHGVVI
jgi:hypothetical protein